MKLIYGGPIDEVEVPEAGVTAPRGEPVEIPDDVAARLLEQKEIWSEAPAEEKPQEKPKTGGRKAADAGGEG